MAQGFGKVVKERGKAVAEKEAHRPPVGVAVMSRRAYPGMCGAPGMG